MRVKGMRMEVLECWGGGAVEEGQLTLFSEGL